MELILQIILPSFWDRDITWPGSNTQILTSQFITLFSCSDFQKPSFFFFPFGGTGDWTQGLELARQACYCLSPTLSPLPLYFIFTYLFICFLIIFHVVTYVFAWGQPQTMILLSTTSCVPWVTDIHQHSGFNFFKNFYLTGKKKNSPKNMCTY
jgi:hypothetical protein